MISEIIVEIINLSENVLDVSKMNYKILCRHNAFHFKIVLVFEKKSKTLENNISDYRELFEKIS